MTESRQVRRARERAEAKEALGEPVRRSSASPSRPTVEQVITVNLSRYAEDPAEYGNIDEQDDVPDEYVSWHASWGLEDSSTGTEHSESELQVLVEVITRDLVRRGSRYSFQIEWTLRGDPPADGTLDDAVTDAGVALPTRWPAPDISSPHGGLASRD
jgi:hypothetical protein